jgi:hypothetical protein
MFYYSAKLTHFYIFDQVKIDYIVSKDIPFRGWRLFIHKTTTTTASSVYEYDCCLSLHKSGKFLFLRSHSDDRIWKGPAAQAQHHPAGCVEQSWPRLQEHARPSQTAYTQRLMCNVRTRLLGSRAIGSVRMRREGMGAGERTDE